MPSWLTPEEQEQLEKQLVREIQQSGDLDKPDILTEVVIILCCLVVLAVAIAPWVVPRFQ